MRCSGSGRQLAGPKVKGLHVVKLAPGEWVRLCPANTVLACVRSGKIGLPATLMLTLSSGSGLVGGAPRAEMDGRDLCWACLCAGLSCCASCDLSDRIPVTLALFVARRIAPEDPALPPVDFPGDDVSCIASGGGIPFA